MTEQSDMNTSDPPELTVGPKLVAFLVADYAAAHSDGKATVAGIFDNILLQPGQTNYSFYVFVKIINLQSNTITVRCLNPAGQAISELNLDVPQEVLHGEAEPAIIQGVVQFQAPFTERGVHSFEVRNDGSLLGVLPLKVQIAQEQ